jgi:hypothetical protein
VESRSQAKVANPLGLPARQIVLALRAAEPIPRGLTDALAECHTATTFGPSEQHVVVWALFIGLAVCQRETMREPKPIFMKTAPEARNELAQTGRSGCDAIGY